MAANLPAGFGLHDDAGVLVVSQEFPFPPDHGGVADVYRRLIAMKESGLRVGLVCWTDQDVHSSEFARRRLHLASRLDYLTVVPKYRSIASDLRRAFLVLFGLPSHVAARTMRRRDFDELLRSVEKFRPGCIVLDSLYGGECAKGIAATLGLPLLYRAHNIEHRYFLTQAKAEISLMPKISLYLACLNLERYERHIHGRAASSWDISASDLAYWRSEGFVGGGWLPPLPSGEGMHSVSAVDVADERELAFLGNLNAPNNVKGIEWLVKEVMPKVWQILPDVVLTVAVSVARGGFSLEKPKVGCVAALFRSCLAAVPLDPKLKALASAAVDKAETVATSVEKGESVVAAVSGAAKEVAVSQEAAVTESLKEAMQEAVAAVADAVVADVVVKVAEEPTAVATAVTQAVNVDPSIGILIIGTPLPEAPPAPQEEAPTVTDEKKTEDVQDWGASK